MQTKQWSLIYYLSANIWRDWYFHVLWLHSGEIHTASSNNVSLSAYVPSSSEPEPQLGTLIFSNITSDSFNVSWNIQAGPLAKIVINVSDSHSLHEPQQFTVSGDAQRAHVTGLVENTGYDVSVTGTTWAGDPTRPLTAFVVTGTLSKVLTCLLRILDMGKGGKGDRHAEEKLNPKYSLHSICKLLSEERAGTTYCKEGSSTATLRKWTQHGQKLYKTCTDFYAQFYRLSDSQFGNSG